MPEQQQWHEGPWGWLRRLLVRKQGYGGATERLWTAIEAAWPSSPQGLAAKALVDAADTLINTDWYDAYEYDVQADILWQSIIAARKAGIA